MPERVGFLGPVAGGPLLPIAIRGFPREISLMKGVMKGLREAAGWQREMSGGGDSVQSAGIYGQRIGEISAPVSAFTSWNAYDEGGIQKVT